MYGLKRVGARLESRPRSKPVTSDDDDLDSLTSSEAEWESDASPQEESTGHDRDYDFGEEYQWTHLKKSKKPNDASASNKNGGLPNFAEGLYDKTYWRADLKDDCGQFVELKDLCHNFTYVVPLPRVNKAMRFLTMPSVREVFNGTQGASKPCTCKTGTACPLKGLNVDDIRRQRYVYFQQGNESDSTRYLADLVRSHNAATTEKPTDTPNGSTTKGRRVFNWVLKGHRVCAAFFRKAFGISKDKHYKVTALLTNPAARLPGVRVESVRPRVKYTQCRAFWRAFFKNCQRPNEFTRLFPVNMSFPCIYEDFFTPWFAKVLPNIPVSDMPCLGYFVSARRDDEFKDVKNRAKHHHCRCATCANLQARRLAVFNSKYDKDQFVKEWRDHQNEKRWWREYEDELVMASRHSPRERNCFWFDDTSACGFPNLTLRTLKNLPTSRFQLIPFLITDLARGKDYYVYTAKGRFKKGANRLCTTLLKTIRATKFSEDESRHARVLSLIADNYSENKNNTLFAFLSDLVLRGWYDEIIIVYGPTGHTHNGGDKKHHIHNVVLFNFTLPTFVHMLNRYDQAWRQEHSRPTPCVLDVQYDFDAYYKPFMRPIGGHTNTECDPVSARAFKFSRGPSGIVTMEWKTKAESGDWRGAGGQVGTPGFQILRMRPRGVPSVLPPIGDVMHKKHYKQLLGKKMTECMQAEACPEAMDWLKKSAKHGVMPIDKRVQDVGDVSPGALGSRVQLKCGEATAEVQVIEDIEASEKEFWALPDDLAQAALRGRADDEDAQWHEMQSDTHRRHPNIGYRDVPNRRRPTYSGSGRQAVDEAKRSLEADDSDDDDGNGSECDVGNDGDGSDSSSDSASEAGVRQRRSKQSKRSRAGCNSGVEEVDVSKVKYKVKVVLGEGDNGRELWIGIVSACRTGNRKTRFQWLQEIETRPGMYELLQSTDVVDNNQIVHDFGEVSFVRTKTYQLTKGGKRRKTGVDVKIVTEKPFDTVVLDSILHDGSGDN